ncbi:SOS response-associated peptidase family protein [Nitrospirillum sp. BR 11163]|uniref:SOS response-associated peptidase family protein n=1 Tax=Nitrospirillum sp. BR 11163 TaxID=3104323 RepID=UPI003A4C588B
MCGRYSITTPPEALRQLFATLGPLPNFAPRYNLPPTASAPVTRLHSETGERHLGLSSAALFRTDLQRRFLSVQWRAAGWSGCVWQPGRGPAPGAMGGQTTRGRAVAAVRSR